MELLPEANVPAWLFAASDLLRDLDDDVDKEDLARCIMRATPDAAETVCELDCTDGERWYRTRARWCVSLKKVPYDKFLPAWFSLEKGRRAELLMQFGAFVDELDVDLWATNMLIRDDADMLAAIPEMEETTDALGGTEERQVTVSPNKSICMSVRFTIDPRTENLIAAGAVNCLAQSLKYPLDDNKKQMWGICAATHGQVRVLNMLYSQDYVFIGHSTIAYAASYCGSVETMDWLWAHGWRPSSSGHESDDAVMYGHFDLFCWHLEHGTGGWCGLVPEAVARAGHLRSLQMMCAIDKVYALYSWGEPLIDIAAAGGYIEMVDWLQEYGNYANLPTSRTFSAAARSGSLALIQKLHVVWCSEEDDYTVQWNKEECADVAAAHGHQHIRDWILSLSAPIECAPPPVETIMCSDCKKRPGYAAQYKIKPGLLEDEDWFDPKATYFSLAPDSDTEDEPVYLCCQCDPCGYP